MPQSDKKAKIETPSVPVQKTSDAKSEGTTVKKKYWRVHSKEGMAIEFFPVFEVSKETGDVEARFVEVKTTSPAGDAYALTMNWLDLYMFVYFACNEELRRNLALRYEKQVNYIPYDVTLQLSKEEMTSGVAKRRVELPVDELTMAIARNEAMLMMMKEGIKDPRAYKFTGKKP